MSAYYKNMRMFLVHIYEMFQTTLQLTT